MKTTRTIPLVLQIVCGVLFTCISVYLFYDVQSSVVWLCLQALSVAIVLFAMYRKNWHRRDLVTVLFMVTAIQVFITISDSAFLLAPPLPPWLNVPKSGQMILESSLVAVVLCLSLLCWMYEISSNAIIFSTLFGVYALCVFAFLRFDYMSHRATTSTTSTTTTTYLRVILFALNQWMFFHIAVDAAWTQQSAMVSLSDEQVRKRLAGEMAKSDESLALHNLAKKRYNEGTTPTTGGSRQFTFQEGKNTRYPLFLQPSATSERDTALSNLKEFIQPVMQLINENRNDQDGFLSYKPESVLFMVSHAYTPQWHNDSFIPGVTTLLTLNMPLFLNTQKKTVFWPTEYIAAHPSQQFQLTTDDTPRVRDLCPLLVDPSRQVGARKSISEAGRFYWHVSDPRIRHRTNPFALWNRRKIPVLSVLIPLTETQTRSF